MNRFRAVLLGIFMSGAAFAAETQPGTYDAVTVEATKTSIYVGSVTLTLSTLRRSGDVFEAEYKAKVFPYFFSNEHGHLWITLAEPDLAALRRGDGVLFKGHAENSDKEERRIEGRAIPADSLHGKIKVRVFVTSKIELIFNTTYRFGP